MNRVLGVIKYQHYDSEDTEGKNPRTMGKAVRARNSIQMIRQKTTGLKAPVPWSQCTNNNPKDRNFITLIAVMSRPLIMASPLT